MGGGSIWRGKAKTKKAARLEVPRVVERRLTKLLHRGELYEQCVEFRRSSDSSITIHLDVVYRDSWTMSQEAGEQVIELFEKAAWGRDKRR